jgi:hypothetical protein
VDGSGDLVGDEDFSSRHHLSTDLRAEASTGARAGQPKNTNAALAARDVLGGPQVHAARPRTAAR